MKSITLIKVASAIIYVSVGAIMEHVFKITEPTIYMFTGVVFGIALCLVLDR